MISSIAGKTLAIFLFVAILAGCATIVGQSSPEQLNVRTTPDQAKIEISDESGMKIFEGATPTIVTLEKKKGYFQGKTYTVKITKEGFSEQIMVVNTRLNGWYLGGNILFGGLIGWLIVDPATGAMWSLETNEVHTNLTASSPNPAQPAQVGVVLLQDVPASLQSKMVKLSDGKSAD
jgi:hypothetical protein